MADAGESGAGRGVGRGRGRGRGKDAGSTAPPGSIGSSVDTAPKRSDFGFDEECISASASYQHDAERNIVLPGAAKPRSIAEQLEMHMAALSLNPEKAASDPAMLSLLSSNPVLEEHLKTRPASCTEKRGESGRVIKCYTNYIPLLPRPNFTLYEYTVTFTPNVDSKFVRMKMLKDKKNVLAADPIFDGINLHIGRKLDDGFSLTCKNPRTEEEVNVEFKFVQTWSATSNKCVTLYNLLNRKSFNSLDYKLLGQHFFNLKASSLVEKHRIEVWPGILSTIALHEDSLLMCCDMAHKLLRTETVLDFLYDLFHRTRGERYYERATQALIGTTVITRYNNRLYRVDDILWKKKVTDQFALSDGTKVSYMKYYKDHYGRDIHDEDQPLLLSRTRKRTSKKGRATKVQDVYLVPELCSLTGLTDEIRDDRRAMQDLAQFMRVPPYRRIESSRTYLKDIRQNDAVTGLFNRWGLSFGNELLEVNARVLKGEELQCGNRIITYSDETADWSREQRGAPLNEPKSMDEWIMIFTERDRESAEQFYKTLCKIGPPMGMDIQEPNIIQLPTDRINDYVDAIKYAVSQFPKTSIVVPVVPNDNKTRYDAIKKLCCIDMPIPSQVVNTMKSLKNKKNLMTIVTKIAMQINVKLDGTLWNVQIPMRNIMVIGYDIYHDTQQKGKSVGACLFSTDALATKYFCQCAIHGDHREQVENLIGFFKNGLKKYHERNGVLPDKIVFYRDGVVEGQLPAIYQYELGKILEVMRYFGADYKPKFTFVVISKRMHARFFEKLSSGECDNPPPGTVVDTAITRPDRYDFFLVPQCVRQGTVTPVCYNVIYDNSGLKPEHLQRFTFKLCHLYYNWQGTVRVPGPCQYAKKLSFFVGQSLHKPPDPSMCDRLFFL